MEVSKVDGVKNPSDMMTKGLTRGKIDEHMDRIGQQYRQGRVESSLEVGRGVKERGVTERGVQESEITTENEQ